MSDALQAVPERILGSRAGKAAPNPIKLYDFRRPDKFSKEQIRTMQNISESFSRLMATSLSAAMRLPCELRLDMVDQMTYDEFIAPLASPALLGVASMEPLKGAVVLHVDAAGTDAILERVFGATPVSTAKPLSAGGITDIEVSSLERLLVSTLKDLGEAWSFVEGIKPHLMQIETEARFCQIVPPGEMIILSSFTITVGAVQGKLDIAYPFLVLEPIIHMLSAKYWYEPRGQKSTAEGIASARRAVLPAEIVCGAGSLPLGFLKSLRKGSVVYLPGCGEGKAWLRLGGTRVVDLSGLNMGDGSVSAVPEGLNANKPQDDPFAQDPVTKLSEELRNGFDSIKSGVSEAMAAMSHRIEELKGSQEDLSDRFLFGQADTAVSRPAARPFSSLSGVQAESMALFLASERPQVCALVLSFIDDALGARVLSLLPETIQPDVARRVANMNWVVPETLADAERVLGKKLLSIDRTGPEPGGIQKVVGILNYSPRETERLVITALDLVDPELSESIKRNMFVFEDIIILDDESIAAVLEVADEKDIVVAMKPVPEEVRERLFARFPADKRDRLRTALLGLGRMKLSDCDAAGFRVVEIIRKLEEEGRIGIVRPGE